MEILHSQELSELKIKHPAGEDTENMRKGLALLKEAMTNLKVILGSEPDVVTEQTETGTGSGAQSSQSQKESEDTEVAKSTDESVKQTTRKKSRMKVQEDQEEVEDISSCFSVSSQ